jgi:hypothetical protein
MVFCFMCPEDPPQEVKSKGSRGIAAKYMLNKQGNPHRFALGLKDAPSAEPGCCILSSLGVYCGFTACWARKAVLERYENGIEDFMCCQGYIGACCCIDPRTMLKGQALGLYLEGCLCPVFSLSIARLHLMVKKQLRPDPMDYQLIACSNALQIISQIADIVAAFFEPAKEVAHVIDLIADLFTCSVGGCMGAQIYHEINKDKDEIVYIVVEGVPVAGPGAGLAAQDGAAVPQVAVVPPPPLPPPTAPRASRLPDPPP